jgi:hypothetical protein
VIADGGRLRSRKRGYLYLLAHLPAPQRGGGVTALTKGAKNLFKKKRGDETVLGGDTASWASRRRT